MSQHVEMVMSSFHHKSHTPPSIDGILNLQITSQMQISVQILNINLDYLIKNIFASFRKIYLHQFERTKVILYIQYYVECYMFHTGTDISLV